MVDELVDDHSREGRASLAIWVVQIVKWTQQVVYPVPADTLYFPTRM